MTAPVHILCLTGSVRLACGSDEMHPASAGTFVNTIAELQLKPGDVISWDCSNFRRLCVGLCKTRSVLVTFRSIHPDYIPKSITARNKLKHNQDMTSVKPAPISHGESTCANNNDSEINHAAKTPNIEQEHVINVYETIAAHWHRTRHSPWPKVVEFLHKLEIGSIVADIGCGNGKYMSIRKDIFVLGCDRSVNLCDLCSRRNCNVTICDNMTVSFVENSFDAVLSVAVLHHFSTQARRQRAVNEVFRLLRPGGCALIQAWALEQVIDFIPDLMLEFCFCSIYGSNLFGNNEGKFA